MGHRPNHRHATIIRCRPVKWYFFRIKHHFMSRCGSTKGCGKHAILVSVERLGTAGQLMGQRRCLASGPLERLLARGRVYAGSVCLDMSSGRWQAFRSSTNTVPTPTSFPVKFAGTRRNSSEMLRA